MQESWNFTGTKIHSKNISINFKSVIQTRLVILAMMIVNSLQQPLGGDSRKKLRKLQLLNVSNEVKINCCFEAAILHLSARHKKSIKQLRIFNNIEKKLSLTVRTSDNLF